MTKARRDVVGATHLAEQLIDSVPESSRQTVKAFMEDPAVADGLQRVAGRPKNPAVSSRWSLDVSPTPPRARWRPRSGPCCWQFSGNKSIRISCDLQCAVFWPTTHTPIGSVPQSPG